MHVVEVFLARYEFFLHEARNLPLELLLALPPPRSLLLPPPRPFSLRVSPPEAHALKPRGCGGHEELVPETGEGHAVGGDGDLGAGPRHRGDSPWLLPKTF